MFSVPHLVVLFIVVLVFFGPHKLPELARGLGKLMAEFRKASNDFKMAFEEEMRTIERQARENEWKKSQEAAEAKRNAELAAGEGNPSAANPSSTSDDKSLPEHATASEQVEVLDPVVSPVSEAIARDANHSEGSAEPAIDVPAEEATSSDTASSSTHASAVTEPTDLSSQPNDHRQPA